MKLPFSFHLFFSAFHTHFIKTFIFPIFESIFVTAYFFCFLCTILSLFSSQPTFFFFVFFSLVLSSFFCLHLNFFTFSLNFSVSLIPFLFFFFLILFHHISPTFQSFSLSSILPSLLFFSSNISPYSFSLPLFLLPPSHSAPSSLHGILMNESSGIEQKYFLSTLYSLGPRGSLSLSRARSSAASQ